MAFLDAGGGEFPGAGNEFCFPLGNLAVDLFDFDVSGFEGFQFLAGLVSELDDFFDGGAVFAFEGLESVDLFFEFCEAIGVDVDGVQIAGELSLPIVGLFGELGVRVGEWLSLRIELDELPEFSADSGKGVGKGRLACWLSAAPSAFRVADGVEDGLPKLTDLGGVLGALVIVFQGLFIKAGELGFFDFSSLEAKKVYLSGAGLFVGKEGLFLAKEGFPFSELQGVGKPLGGDAGEVVQEFKLFLVVEEGLVVVGSVNVDEVLSKRREYGERGGGVIDELAVVAGGGDGAAKEKLGVFAGFEAVFGEEILNRCVEGGDVEDGFDGAVFRAGAD